MAKIKRCKECGKTYKSSKTYEYYVSDKICPKCMDEDMLKMDEWIEYQYACGGVELFL